MQKGPDETRRAPGDAHPETLLVHGVFHSSHWDFSNQVVPPMTASTAFRLQSVERGAEGFREFANPEFNRARSPQIFIYDRMDEPVRGLLEENLAVAEGAETAICFATGMAAISGALLTLLKAGDRIVAHRTLYGCTYSLFTNWLPRLGVQPVLIDLNDAATMEHEIAHRDVMVVYLETPANPTLDLIDIAAIRRQADAVNQRRGKRRRVYVVVDNTFATPFCQRPLQLGADLVVESLTKGIGGFGTDMGGMVAGSRLLEPDLLLVRKDFGACLSPRNAWSTLVHGLPTLAMRLRHQQETALEMARLLEAHDLVSRVSYPGLDSFPQRDLARTQMRDFDGGFAPGAMIYFVLEGDPVTAIQRGRKLMNHMASVSRTYTLAVSLGQIRTLVEHPASMTHAAIPPETQLEAGLDPGGVRISVGIEKAEDLLDELSEALDAAR